MQNIEIRKHKQNNTDLSLEPRIHTQSYSDFLSPKIIIKKEEAKAEAVDKVMCLKLKINITEEAEAQVDLKPQKWRVVNKDLLMK